MLVDFWDYIFQIWLTVYACPALPVLHCLSCSACPVLFWLSCSGCPVLTVLAGLSSPC
jgi:hypothetical protein